MCPEALVAPLEWYLTTPRDCRSERGTLPGPRYRRGRQEPRRPVSSLPAKGRKLAALLEDNSNEDY